jgi:hypothetical protein
VEEPLELVHADLCGVVTLATSGGHRYFLPLIDDQGRYMWLILLSTKDEAATTLKCFQAEVQTEAQQRLCMLRMDRGGEFTPSALAAHFTDTSVKQELTVVGMAMSMLKDKGMPNFFWGKAVMMVVYLLNRSFTHSIDDKMPYEAWHRRRRPMSSTCVCLAASCM